MDSKFLEYQRKYVNKTQTNINWLDIKKKNF